MSRHKVDRQAPERYSKLRRDGCAVTDKTGTLTRGTIFLEHHLDVSGVKAAGY